MADDFKVPMPTIEQNQDTPDAAPAGPEPVANPVPKKEPFSAGKAAGRIGAWFKATFPGHENAVVFGIIGLIAAVLIFVVGIWRALIVAIFVVAGVAIGQVVDGDPKILRALQRILSDRHS